MECWNKIKIGLKLGLWLLGYGVLAVVKGVVTVVGWVGWLVRRPWLRTALLLGLGVSLLVGLGWVADSHRKAAICANNLRQLYQALRQYEADTGFLPQVLGDLHPTYLPYDSPVLLCPADHGYSSWAMTGTRTNYIYACLSTKMRRVPKGSEADPRSLRAMAYDKERKRYKEPVFFKSSDFPPDFVLIMCSGGHWVQGGGYNQLYNDGSVSWSRFHTLTRPDARLGLDRANTYQGQHETLQVSYNVGLIP